MEGERSDGRGFGGDGSVGDGGGGGGGVLIMGVVGGRGLVAEGTGAVEHAVACATIAGTVNIRVLKLLVSRAERAVAVGRW